jgi:hypothetical protein
LSYPVDNALFEWEEGYRRLQELTDRPSLYTWVNQVIDAVRDDLRRRVGATFTVAELADEYGRGTEWVLEIANRMDPEGTISWDPQLLAGAAFHMHLRGAKDWAGGRYLTVE